MQKFVSPSAWQFDVVGSELDFDLFLDDKQGILKKRAQRSSKEVEISRKAKVTI